MNRRSLQNSLRRWTRRIAAGFLALLALYAVGRPIQKGVDSLYFGERAPYLQMLTDNAVTVRWQTVEAEKGAVWLGTAPETLTQHAVEEGPDDEHEIRLTGLEPATRYYYAVGDAQAPRWGRDGSHWFVTAPAQPNGEPVRLWVIGDSGYPGEGQRAVRAALDRYLQQRQLGLEDLNLWLTLGDNAYRSGKAEEFQAGFFDAYPLLVRSLSVWPVHGNHDARRWVHYDVFSLPENGEAGGVPSGTESYFSFDYGPLHVVILDTEDADLDGDGAMAQWLRRDLAASERPWTIAAFHHPPYTRGGHDSDDEMDSWGRLVDVRENILPILEAAGVDLVLSGHSHVYERSYLLDCHYGSSGTLKPSMVLQREGPYRKAPGPHQGTVYVVAGSSSKVNSAPLDHPVMDVAMGVLGSLLIEVEGNRLTGRFIDSAAQVRDKFTLVKETQARRPVGCN